MPRWLRLFLQFLLTGGVVAALVVTVDRSALLRSLQDAHWGWVTVAVLLLPANLFLDGWVWNRLLDAVEGEFPSWHVAKAVLSGMALGFWTPVRLGEYAGRSFALPGADRWSVSLSVFVQRMVDMAVGVNVGLVLLVAVLWTGPLSPSLPWLLAAAVGLGTGGGLTAVLLFPGLLERGWAWLGAKIPKLRSGAAFFRRLTPSHGFDVVGGTLARYFIFTGQFLCLGLAFTPSASLFPMFAAVGLTFYAKYLLPSLTFLDLGIREGGAVFFFQLLGLGAAAGLNASLLLYAINVLLPAVFGVPLVGSLSLADTSESDSDAAVSLSVPSRS